MLSGPNFPVLLNTSPINLISLTIVLKPKKLGARMKPGRFRLSRPTIGVSVDGPRTKCMVVPANEIIEVILPDSLSPRRTTTVKWRDLVLSMFTEDVSTRVVALADPRT